MNAGPIGVGLLERAAIAVARMTGADVLLERRPMKYQLHLGIQRFGMALMDFPIPPGFDNYKLRWSGLSNDAGSPTNNRIQVSYDGGLSFSATAGDYQWVSHRLRIDGTESITTDGGADTSLSVTRDGVDGSNGEVIFWQPHQATNQKLVSFDSVNDEFSTYNCVRGMGRIAGATPTATYNAIRFCSTTAGNVYFTRGVIELFGMGRRIA